MEYVIGVDPGSTKGHGVAIYINGQLKELHMMRLMELYDFCKLLIRRNNVVVHIEDVYGKKGNWHGSTQSKEAYAQSAQNTGLCKWAQVEVERMCAHIGVEIVKHPVSRRWKTQAQKKEFERATGWIGRSNEDTRSAAWFGFLGLKLK